MTKLNFVLNLKLCLLEFIWSLVLGIWCFFKTLPIPLARCLPTLKHYQT